MGEGETLNMERGLAGMVAKWKGVLAVLAAIAAAAFGGYDHLRDIEDSINSIKLSTVQADARISALEATSVRDREAIVRMEVALQHATEILRRLETKIDNRNP